MVVNERVLSQIRGVVHVGANIGQERDAYATHNLNVLWFEPNPEAFKKLENNIADLQNQIAFPFLLTDRDDANYLLHVTNGHGQASSILEMGEQIRLYPDFTCVRDVEALSLTLDTFFRDVPGIRNNFQFLVIDTQGSELFVLKGATRTLKHLQFVEVETSPLEMYKGGCLEQEVIDFMMSQGFKETERIVVNPSIDNHVLFERA